MKKLAVWLANYVIGKGKAEESARDVYEYGFHLEHYWSCLLLSCITFFGVLLIVRYVEVPIMVSLILSGILVWVIWLLYPVEHSNRLVDEEENKYFKRRVRVILIFDAILGLVFLLFGNERYLLLMASTLMVVVLAMILGKIKYKKTI